MQLLWLAFPVLARCFTLMDVKVLFKLHSVPAFL